MIAPQEYEPLGTGMCHACGSAWMYCPCGHNPLNEERKKAKEQFKKDDEDLFGSPKESKYDALLAIAKELQTCCDNMGLKPRQDDPEIVSRARSASAQLNQFLSAEKL